MRKLFFAVLLLLVSSTCFGLDNTYTKVTDKDQLKVGDKVVFALNTDKTPANVVSGFGKKNNSETGDATISTTESDWLQFTIYALNNSAFQLSCSENKFLKGGKGASFKSDNSSEKGTWFLKDSVPFLTCGVEDGTSWAYYDLSRNLTYSGGSLTGTYYRYYKVTNRTAKNYTPFHIWKVESSCQKLAEINGSIC